MIVVGGGPAGLSCAEGVASRGHSVVVLEQNKEIGNPIRTSGGSFVSEMVALDVPPHLYHTVKRCRLISPNEQAVFDYDSPAFCVLDVRRLYQYLAEKTIRAGGHIRLTAKATDILSEGGQVVGVAVSDTVLGTKSLKAKVVVDATGYHALLAKRAGVHSGFKRFGVGAEFDMFAPNIDESETVLIVGNQIAPSGYGWIFPYGNNRVRVGVGVIHGDTSVHPNVFLPRLIEYAASIDVDLSGAQPVEYHYGLIPSDGLSANMVGDGILAVGDSAGQASTLVGEGIRWAMSAGRLAGQVLDDCLRRGDFSASALSTYETRWRNEHERNLNVASKINQRVARYSDDKWDERIRLVKMIDSLSFAEALKSNFFAAWPLKLLASNPSLVKFGFKEVFGKMAKMGGGL